MSTEVFPAQWNVPTIVPLYKNGPFYDPQNYRPINRTQIPSGLTERIVKDHVIVFLMTIDLIVGLQHSTLIANPVPDATLPFMIWSLHISVRNRPL